MGNFKNLSRFLAAALFSLLLVIAQQVRAQDVLYSNDFADAASVSDWVLSGSVGWNEANGGQLLTWGSANTYAVMPILPESTTDLVISITAFSSSRFALYTSPDGVVYTDQGTFSGGFDNVIRAATKTMPNGTRYVKFVLSNSGITSLTITGNASICTEFFPVSGISMRKNSTTLQTNTTEHLIAVLTPSCVENKKTVWSSSDFRVATVNSAGLVTAGLPGTTTITATTADGGFAAQCQVTVVLSSTSSNTISTNLNQWFSEVETDNNMQFTSGGSKYIIANGQTYPYYTFEGANTAYPRNINNDEAVDFHISNSGGEFDRKIQIVRENGETEIIPLQSSSRSVISPCDYNSDGLTDFLIGEEVFIQGANNTFTQKKLNVMSREMYENGYEAKSSWTSFADLSLAKDMFVGLSSGTPYIPPREPQMLDIDISGNGLPDLLNTSNGELWLNMGNDTYVREQLGGYIMFRDLTGNGKQDYVVFDQNKKTVVANILQDDGTWKSQTLMSNLSMDNQIWAYDYDGDGHTDIILPFSYSTSNGAAFLVVMVNDGNGNFTMKENYYTQQLKFIACVDLDNDGYYDVVAIDGWTGSGSSAYGTSVVWFKGNAQYKFDLQTQPLYTATRISDIAVADVNNDGKYDLITTHTSVSYGTSGVYPINITSTVCQPPHQPAKPEFAYEPSTGYLKVSWQSASDPRYSSVDLTYELRIGSAPGKGDMVYAYAYADGRRRNLMDGNANYALEKLIDASAWNVGDYYISIQAINPMRRGSAFSQEAVFTKMHLPAKFVISDENTTSDEITVMLLNPRDANLEYLWNFDGGVVVDSNTDSTVLKLKFTAPGQKRITLQTRNAAGEISAVYMQETFLFANKFTETFSFSPNRYGTNNNRIVSPSAFADLDNCGKLEALTDNGIYENDGQGNFTKLNKIFNTNLDFGRLSLSLFDYNNNGMADIFADGSVYKNSSTAGDITFPIAGENLSSGFGSEYSMLWDLNNDGKADVFSVSNRQLLLNNGNYKNFTSSYNSNYLNGCTIIDLNKDGFLDAINCYSLYNSNTRVWDYYALMLFNNGKGFFTEKNILLSLEPLTSNYPKLFIDINNDGYVDLLMLDNSSFAGIGGNKIYIHLNNQNESFEKPVVIVLPETKTGFRFAYDLDNNGYLDIALEGGIYGNGILYFYENLQTRYYKTDIMLYNHIIADVDNDGVQDIFTSNGFYKNNTTVTNTPPAPPTNIRWAQTDETLFIEWDAAYDAESPAAMLRYNISVKKQGATGDNAYIISPLNNLTNGALPVSLAGYPYNPYYRTATRMEIPLTAFTAGENYEIQIQTLDGWNAVSTFSSPIVAKVVSNPQIKIPASICVGLSTSVEYKGTGTPAQRTWNWDGGTLLSENGNRYEVVWNSAGAKTVSVTVGGTTSEASLRVLEAVNTTLPIPDVVSAQTLVRIVLPDPQFGYAMAEAYYDANQFIFGYPPSGGGFSASRPVPVWQVNATTGAAALTLPQAGYYSLRIDVNTPCGIESKWYGVQAVNIPKPAIRLITADESKNRIEWEVPSNLPSFVTGVNVYREGTKYNDFILEASLPLSQTAYVDPYSNINIMASRYRIAWTTEHGAESQPSVPHKGIHLMINKGIGNGWNLFWGQYEGAIVESFRILRGSDSENLTLLAELPGSTASYSDLAPPAGELYYAVEYNTVYTPEFLRSGSSESGRSNVVGVADAFSVKPAAGLSIDSRNELTPAQPSMFVVANITPQTATYRTANFTVVSGNDLATINSMGILTLTGAGNGSVTIQATTIDGSELKAQKTIQVKNVITSIEIRADRGILSPEFNQTNLYADILPVEMSWSNVEWSITGKSGNFDATLSGNQLSVSNIVSKGTITVRATTTNGSGMYVEGVVEVLTASTSVIDVPVAPPVVISAYPQLYPNPFTGTVYITGADGYMLQVVNVAGITVYTQAIISQAETLRLEYLTAGLYFFRFEKEGVVRSVKMVKY